MIVPSSVVKNGITNAEVKKATENATTENQSENRNMEEEDILWEHGIETPSRHEVTPVNDKGVCVELGNSDPEDEPNIQPQHWRKFTKTDSNSIDARYLLMYVCGQQCLRVI